MSKNYAHYTDSTKKNVVAAVRSGLSIRGIGKRLSIPLSTISQWVHDPRYSDVAPASETENQWQELCFEIYHFKDIFFFVQKGYTDTKQFERR